jgi:hypothetical protein
MSSTFATRAASSSNAPLLRVMGEIFKVTPVQYKKTLAAIAGGKDWASTTLVSTLAP